MVDIHHHHPHYPHLTVVVSDIILISIPDTLEVVERWRKGAGGGGERTGTFLPPSPAPPSGVLGGYIRFKTHMHWQASCLSPSPGRTTALSGHRKGRQAACPLPFGLKTKRQTSTRLALCLSPAHQKATTAPVMHSGLIPHLLAFSPSHTTQKAFLHVRAPACPYKMPLPHLPPSTTLFKKAFIHQ